MNSKQKLYFIRYEKFINSRPKRIRGLELLENHHIKPRKLFPELVNEESNLILLTPREHYIAHYMLAIIYGGSMWFAFNQMRRVIPGDIKTSTLHEQSRKYISDIISKSNRGRKRSEEDRRKMSDRYRETIIVRPKDGGKAIRVSIYDERYISGELISDTCGRNHSQETLLKMSDNGIKNRTMCNNGISSIFVENIIPEGYNLGGLPANHVRERHKNTKWYHDPLTNENYRIKSEEEIPENLIIGRSPNYNNRGFQFLNDTNNIHVYDLINREAKVVSKEDWKKYPHYVSSPLNGYIVKWGNYIFESCSTFNYLNGEFMPSIGVKNLDKIFKLHFNQKPNIQKFCLLYENMSYNILGFDIIKIKEYEYLENDIFIRLIDGKEKNEQIRRIILKKERT